MTKLTQALPPSTLVVIGLISGICLAHTGLFLAITSVLVAISTLYGKPTVKFTATLSLSMIIGIAIYQNQVFRFQAIQKQLGAHKVNLVGTVIDYTRVENNLFKHRLTIKTDLISNQFQQPSKQDFTLYIYTKKFPRAYLGDLILIKNLVLRPNSDQQFQFFLIKNQINASTFIPNLDFKKIYNPNQPTFAKYKRYLLKTINNKMSAQTKVMFNSIFLGNKLQDKNQINHIKHNFQTWGIVHYLARSGLHLVIISTIWQTVCRTIWLPLIASNLIILLFIAIFSLLSWTALPFMRALIVIVIYRICQLCHLQLNLIHALNISCIILIFANPISLFGLDFQLSFFLTYGLVLFSQILRAHKGTNLPKNKFLPNTL